MVERRKLFDEAELKEAQQAVSLAASANDGEAESVLTDDELRAYGYEPAALFEVVETVVAGLLDEWPDVDTYREAWVNTGSALVIGACIVGQALNNREDAE